MVSASNYYDVIANKQHCKFLFAGGRSETSLTEYFQSEEARLSRRSELWDRSSQIAFHKGYGFVCKIYVDYIGEHAAKCREQVTGVRKFEGKVRTDAERTGEEHAGHDVSDSSAGQEVVRLSESEFGNVQADRFHSERDHHA